MPGSQAVGELVQEVAARGGDASVVTRQVPAGLGAALRVPFLPRQRPLQPPRPRLRLAQVPRRRDGRPVAGRDDAVQADVDPDVLARVPLARNPQLPHLELERDVPLPVRAADDRVHRLRRQRAVPPDLDETRDPDEPQPPALADQPVADAEVRAVEARLRAESGKARSPSRLHAAEECGEGLVEPAQDLLPGAAAASGQFRDRVPDCLQLVRLVRVAKADALPVPCLDPLLETRVAEVTEVSGHVREGRFLRPVRAGPVLVAPDQVPAHVRHVFHPPQAGCQCKQRRAHSPVA